MNGNGSFVGDSDNERAGEAETAETRPPAAEESAGEEVIAESSALERVVAERDEYLDTLKRLQAEFDNYRKRTVRQQTDLLQRASERVVERLLPVVDALDLTLAHIGPEKADAAQLKAALEQVDALLRKTLEQEGLERIDETGVPFDPAIHDAVAHETASPAEEEDEQPRQQGARVSEVMRAGYRMQGRVLRPAMVKVEG